MDRIFALTSTPTIVLDPSGTILQVSRGFCDVINCHASDFHGLALPDFGDRKLVLIDLATLQYEIHKAVLVRQPIFTPPFIVKGTVWRTRISPVFETSGELLYIVVVFEDYTETYETQTVLQAKIEDNEIYR